MFISKYVCKFNKWEVLNMRRISVELIATEREMVGTLDFPSAGRSLMTDREQMNWKCAKHSYTMQATPVLIFSSLSGSSESIMPDEWFQILWYCCDQSQKVLRWDGQKRKKIYFLRWWFPWLYQIIKYNLESNLKPLTLIFKVI